MSDLMIPENIVPAEVFTEQGTTAIIDAIREKVMSFVIDPTTKSGREQATALAYKVSRSKTFLDDRGKELVEEWKSKSKGVDAQRKRVRDALDALRDEIKAPVVEYENREKARTKGHEDALDAIANLTMFTETLSSDGVKSRQDLLTTHADRNWEEFAKKAEIAIGNAKTILSALFKTKQADEQAQAELDQMLAAEEERAQKEREEKLQEEAEERGRQQVREQLEREQEQQEATRKAEEDAQAKREANKKHRTKIHGEASVVLVRQAGLTPEAANAVIELIATAQVPHVKISY